MAYEFDYTHAMTIILKIAVPSPLPRTFDYLLPQDFAVDLIKPGMRVLVSFGRQKLVGMVMAIANESEVDPAKLKEILAILDHEPLVPKAMLELISWTSNYYHHPIGDVVANALPANLRDAKRKDNSGDSKKTCKKNIVKNQRVTKNTVQNPIKPLILNTEQQAAIDQINAKLDGFYTFLLDGVTGSGKTEVYLRVLESVLQNNRQALILVPEINLTPQTITRFEERFSVPIAVLHSRLTYKERLNSWNLARTGVAPIIIGTRSAIFTPMKNPGIIILDEEHDLSFKQQTGLKYSARDLANVRGKIETIPVILGSATPSLESIYNVKRKNFHSLILPKRAGEAKQPSFHLLDMRNQKLQDGIAENMLKAMEKHLAQNGQILVFLNRRGFAPVLICHKCSWTAGCQFCDAKMTLHQQQKQLHCHHCGIIKRQPHKCPECEGTELIALGTGTERIEMSLAKYFPDTKIVRIDRDTTRKKDSIQQMLDDIQQNNYQILIGTQMLAKGHHFPHVTMAAILNVDNSLFSADFRASEHLAQLIVQVAGRAGRAEKSGEVYLQTHNPQHPLLRRLLTEGYSGFVKEQLAERKLSTLPPFAHLALIRAESKQQDAAMGFLRLLRQQTASLSPKNVSVFGPVPAVMERKSGHFRAQVLFQSINRNELHQTISAVLDYLNTNKLPGNIKWHLDIDPQDLLQ